MSEGELTFSFDLFPIGYLRSVISETFFDESGGDCFHSPNPQILISTGCVPGLVSMLGSRDKKKIRVLRLSVNFM